jgi:hypothetical protein
MNDWKTNLQQKQKLRSGPRVSSPLAKAAPAQLVPSRSFHPMKVDSSPRLNLSIKQSRESAQSLVALLGVTGAFVMGVIGLTMIYVGMQQYLSMVTFMSFLAWLR